MTDSIETILASLASERHDSRTHFFALQALPNSAPPAISGRVLETSDLQALRAALPPLADTSAVQVLRQPHNPILSVATNLTSLHREPSFLAEMLTQLVNGMQVELLFEQGRWCFVRQLDGYLGWAYRPCLTADPLPTATHLFTAVVEPLRAQPDPNAAILTRVMAGTALAQWSEQGNWSEIEMSGGLRGWLPKQTLRSFADIPSSPAQRRQQIASDAARMMGNPYLWGGSSANGIDCSGLAQLVHRWAGLTIPRDADMQCAAGRTVEPPFQSGDLLFFGEHGEQRSITHVGISLGGWQIIHSSRSQTGVYCDDVQAVPHLKDSFLEAATFLA